MRFYAKNWLLIVSVTLAGLFAGLIYNSFIQVPMYRSSATLLLIDPTKTRTAQDVTLINNYVELFQSRRVIEPVIEAQKIDTTYEALVSSVSATNEKGTEVINVSVSTTDPERSQKFLRGTVNSFKNQVAELYGKDNISVVDNASEAIPPYNVKHAQQLAIATAAGFVVSLIVLFFIYDIKGDGLDKKGNKKKTVAASAAPKKPAAKAATTTPKSTVAKKAPAKRKPTAAKKKTTKPTESN